MIMAPLTQDDENWRARSESWFVITKDAHEKYVFANQSNTLPYGTYVYVDGGLRVEPGQDIDDFERRFNVVKEYLVKQVRIAKP